MKIIYALIKIFEEESYADSFLEHGEMFCQPLKNFREIEDDNTRGDKHEGASHWIQPQGVNLKLTATIDGKPQEIILTEKDFAGPLVISSGKYDLRNIFCMYAIAADDFHKEYNSEQEKQVIIDELNRELKEKTVMGDDLSGLGKHAIIILNVNSFIGKINEYKSEYKIGLAHGAVQYFDDNLQNEPFKGIEAVFRKRKIYSNQNEYRFAFDIKNDGSNEIIKIGSLKDIAIKVPFEALKCMEMNFEADS